MNVCSGTYERRPYRAGGIFNGATRHLEGRTASPAPLAVVAVVQAYHTAMKSKLGDVITLNDRTPDFTVRGCISVASEISEQTASCAGIKKWSFVGVKIVAETAEQE